MPWRCPGGRWGPQVAAWGVHLRTGYALRWRRWQVGSADDFEQGKNRPLAVRGRRGGWSRNWFFWPPAGKGKPGKENRGKPGGERKAGKASWEKASLGNGRRNKKPAGEYPAGFIQIFSKTISPADGCARARTYPRGSCPWSRGPGATRRRRPGGTSRSKDRR